MSRHQVVGVFRVACSGPGDLAGVQALVEAGRLDPASIVAVMGKTEGNGCVNDHTREYASMAWCHWLAAALAITPAAAARRVALVMSGGTEGVLSPHFTVFARRWVDGPAPAGGKRLVVGTAQTRDFAPHEVGRAAQVDATAQAVRDAMADAGIVSVDDVHFVQVKCPLLTSTAVQQSVDGGHEPATRDTYESMAWSRGASALGVAVGLREVPRDAVTDDTVLRDFSVFSARASASAGIELAHNVVVVLGESAASASPFGITHTVMADAIDADAPRALLRDVAPGRIVNLLAKAEASPDGRVRGARHTMLNDSDINATRHARAAVGGVLASVARHTALYVSGGAEHQGPAGGGPVAAILHLGDPA